MTALAMIIGMVPMAIGLGEGGEQNAPLCRAVIGGLIFATVATLLFVPAVYSLIAHGSRKNPEKVPRFWNFRAINTVRAQPDLSGIFLWRDFDGRVRCKTGEDRSRNLRPWATRRMHGHSQPQRVAKCGNTRDRASIAPGL